jgi:ArsR family transcriptional regulator, arsenate/arsenite/antimonite-responsive transcriptional repressor
MVTSVIDLKAKYIIIQYMLNYRDHSKGDASLPTTLQSFANRLKVLAEPKRLLILNLLMEGVQCNCELGEALNMPANLISHHLRILRKAGLVEVERDALDARWVYYSIHREALEELNEALGIFFDPARIKPRQPNCGPQGSFVRLSDVTITE